MLQQKCLSLFLNWLQITSFIFCVSKKLLFYATWITLKMWEPSKTCETYSQLSWYVGLHTCMLPWQRWSRWRAYSLLRPPPGTAAQHANSRYISTETFVLFWLLKVKYIIDFNNVTNYNCWNSVISTPAAICTNNNNKTNQVI